MSKIEWLERQLGSARQFLQADESVAERLPASRSARFFVEAKHEEIKELERELSLAKAERAKEVLEIRLFGEQVNDGTIPLSLLARIAAPFGELLAATAFRQVSGQDLSGAVPASLRNVLDLRLAGIGAGSTRLLITGNLSPDLAGDSLLEGATKQVFSLLNAERESFFDAVDSVGVRAAKKVNELLSECERNSLGLEFSWIAGDTYQYRWSGRNRELARIRELLDTVQEPLESEQVVQGEVRALSLAGRMELSVSGQRRFGIRYSKDKVDLVKGLHLGQNIDARIRTLTYFDQADRERLKTHHLVDIEDAAP